MNEIQQEKQISNEQLYEKLCEIEALLKKNAINEYSREIWSIQDIADYLGFTYSHTARAIVSSVRFPAPIAFDSLRGGIENSKNKYVAGEVIQFCLKNKKSKFKLTRGDK